MAVIYCYGDRGLIARLVGDNDCLCTLCRIQCKLIACIECNLCAVYFHTFNIFFRNGNRLCFAIRLAVFQSFDNRSCRIKHNSVGGNVGNIAGKVGKPCINHIFIIGIDTEFISVCGKGCACKV